MRKKYIYTSTALLSLFCAAVVSGCADISQENESPEETQHTSAYVSETEHTAKERETGVDTETKAKEEDVTESSATDEAVTEAGLPDYLSDKLSAMSLEDKVAQMFAVMPEAISYASPVTSGLELIDGINEHPVGGILFMGPNINSQEQIKEMIQNVQTYSADRIGLPMFTFVDEEGGSVRRVSGKVEGIPALKGAADMAADGDDIYETGSRVGGYLSELGFNVDFAPVADVVSEESSLVIEDRSFGSDPYVVADCVTAFADGLAKDGVLATFKHFPGHGPTKSDTHTDSAYIDKSLEELKEWDLVPFQAAVDNGASFIMISHSAVNVLDGDGTPGSMSHAVITDLLRDDMGYDGIVVTDAMNMGAVADNYSAAYAAVSAVKAGADIILEPADFYSAYDALLNAVRSGEISEDRIDESVGRILKVKEGLVK